MHAIDELLVRKIQIVLAIAVVAISGLYVFRWVLYPEMTFYVDDWSWLYRANFGNWTSYTILPQAVYNDRPVGALIITVLYKIFGLNYSAFGAMLLILHVVNGILVLVVASKLLSSWFYGMIVGILFVINLNVGAPAWWVGTIFDSTCMFFCMCAFLSFLSKKWHALILTPLFYFLAVRSKEVALPLPLILFSYSFLERNTSIKISEIAKSFSHALRSTWPVLLAFVALAGFYLKLYLASIVAGRDYGPYTPKFDISTVINGAEFYLRNFGFELLSPENALLGFLVLTAVALLTWNRMAILGSVGFLTAASPVLVLATQRMHYYGYVPSFYVALLLVAHVQYLGDLLGSKLGHVWDYFAKATVLLAIAWCIYYVDRVGFSRDWLLAHMRENSRALASLASVLTRVENNSNVVITGLPPGPTNLFYHAPCHAIMVYFKIPTINCRIEGTTADLLALYEKLAAPKILLHYDAGNVLLRARSP